MRFTKDRVVGNTAPTSWIEISSVPNVTARATYRENWLQLYKCTQTEMEAKAVIHKALGLAETI